jgi:hypothetical protein
MDSTVLVFKQFTFRNTIRKLQYEKLKSLNYAAKGEVNMVKLVRLYNTSSLN